MFSLNIPSWLVCCYMFRVQLNRRVCAYRQCMWLFCMHLVSHRRRSCRRCHKSIYLMQTFVAIVICGRRNNVKKISVKFLGTVEKKLRKWLHVLHGLTYRSLASKNLFSLIFNKLGHMQQINIDQNGHNLHFSCMELA